MNREEAIAQARDRWGENAVILVRHDSMPVTYHVGVRLDHPDAHGNYAEYFGSGLTYEDALRGARLQLARGRVLSALRSSCLAGELFRAMMDEDVPKEDVFLIHEVCKQHRGDAARIERSLAEKWNPADDLPVQATEAEATS